MVRAFKRLTLLLFVTQVGFIWASSILLESKGRHQSCLLVAKGKQFSVNFSANDPVLFSVTYKINNQENRLVGQQLTNRFESILSASETAYYCMNWQNNQSNDVRINWQHRPQ